MPARSNHFQRLVAAVHEELGPGWIVSESKALTDIRTGEPREVDIVAEATVSGYPLLLAIEVRDRGRAADVTWVEGLAQKHADLTTSKLVLWSSTGFTEAALKKASALRIEAITPLSLDAAPWAKVARQLIGSTVKIVQPAFDPVVDVTLPDNSVVRWSANGSTVLELPEGDAGVGMPIAYILKELSTNAEIRTAMLDHAPVGSGSFHAIYEPPIQCTVRGPSGEVGVVSRVVVGIETRCEVSPVVVQSVVHNGMATTLAEAEIASGRFRVVVREGASVMPRVQAGIEPE